ncbi:MAG TPA: AI-2E family transporter, partial [Saprospiraceae bacterium]|nr:AI-2E family transporter [Saprospiraceae bacterium]
LLIALLFGLLFWNLRFFVPALLGAYTFYVLLRSPLFTLIERYRWPVKAAAAVLLLLSFVVVMLPVNWVFSMLQGRLMALFTNSDTLLRQAEQVIRQIEVQYGTTLLTPDNIKSLGGWAVGQVQGLLSATVSGLGLLLAMYFILWFMLAEGKRMEHSFFNWLPLRHDNVEYVRHHLNDLVWGNALGIPLMGLVQGFAGLVVYWLAGVNDPWMWFAITFVAGMMPLIGAALAYVPLSLLLLADGEPWKALLIFAYGFLVVGSVDNLARMWVMRKINQTHPLITLFGVVVGLQLFGFIGFVFGPILISLFILLLRIYQKEFHYSPNT